MGKRIDSVVCGLRERIISGHYAQGERLVELNVSAQLGASRTPVRLAFEELEREGLLERLPTRGFRVRAFNPQEVADAIDVRGVLEGMAARLLAERGTPAPVLQALKECVAEGRAFIAGVTKRTPGLDASEWIAMNARLHATLVQAAGNPVLVSALEHVARRPLASAAALRLHGVPSQLEIAFVMRAQQDHEDLVEALESGQAVRAEALMREHAFRSRENKRRLMALQVDPAPGPTPSAARPSKAGSGARSGVR